ncbi:MAG: hypothetical protein RBT11_02205 [Desulfobacterales bacterium]|jgi:hypothetical protein|nr:hypothetical protein [Desulfobacterales bacterium]
MEKEEKRVLHHAPVPGYRAAFYVLLAAACVYLGYIVFSTYY